MISELFKRGKGLIQLFMPAKVLFIACLAYYLVATSIGWNNTILDYSGFRQTQTAISAYYMIGKFPSLAYETPVLGPPWSIPFEFPLYQWIVAAIVTLLGTPLDQTGRFVSVAFFLLTLIPAYHILGALKITSHSRFIMLSLLLISPFYVFWSRAFMIESTVLFLSMSYLASALSFTKEPRVWSGIAMPLFGALAAMVKITTFAVFFLAVALILLITWFRQYRVGLASAVLGRWACLLVLVVGVPLGGVFWWTHVADGYKLLNQFGQQLTSRALWAWNFGTLEQRLRLETWYTILRRESEVVGDKCVVLVAILGLVLARRRWFEFAACAVLYLSGSFIFPNLHYVHPYYAYANNLFLIAAVGVCLTGMTERGGWYAKASLATLLLIIPTSIYSYAEAYYPVQSTNHTREVEIGELIQQVTRSDDVIVIVGCDWSAALPYCSKRRALMLWHDGTPSMDQLAIVQSYHLQIGAIIVRDSPPHHWDAGLIPGIARELGLESQRRMDSYEIFAALSERVVAE
jgi:hypothetical protein